MAGKRRFNTVLSAEDRQELEVVARAHKAERRRWVRAKVVLEAAGGVTDAKIARELGMSVHSVAKWRSRYRDHGLAGLRDASRSGKPCKYGPGTEARILSKLEEPPPPGFSSWNGELVAKALGDVSSAQVWRVLRRRSISLQRRRSWCVSTDPEFEAKAASIVGLYLAPPENALVLCVDEKPGIQALEREQGWLKMPDGKSLTGFSHEYKRHGTSNLFASLDIATGMVKSGHFKSKSRANFMRFMDEVLQGQKGHEVHVILDNLSSHKNFPVEWLDKHPNVVFHYTPTHASWLNQVECWFSILWRGALKGASFRSVKDLCGAIDAFVAAYNETAHHFEWKSAATKPKSLQQHVSNL